jgi:GntR family transcriptional regulator/MocR family aminotransferase
MLYFELDRDKKRLITEQLYQQLRGKVISGELVGGVRLPSSRALSEELCVSRNTVLNALDMLVSEGLLESRIGSGVFVSAEAAALCKVNGQEKTVSAPPNFNQYSEITINFDSGIPALDHFPRSQWNKFASRELFGAPDSVLGYDVPQGRPELRQAIAFWLERSRGIHCSPDQILITSGAKQGLSLVAKCLLRPENTVWMEDPCNANVRSIFSYYTKHLLSIEVDSLGIDPERFPAIGYPSLLFATPSHQFPLGGTLPLQRRIALKQFAAKSGCWIVEDDYDSEFRYDGSPVRSIFELCPERTIYVGTFSKVLCPSLRLGYLVLPASLIEQFVEEKRLLDHHSNSIYQLALAEFMKSGEFEKHIARMKKLYKARRLTLLALLEKLFPGEVTISGVNAGMHLVAELQNVTFADDLLLRLEHEGVTIVPVKKHSLLGGHDRQIILGYANLDEKQMREGLTILKRCIKY